MAVAQTTMSAGNKVASLAEWFDISQEQLGELVGVSRATIASYKHRTNASPSQEKVRALSERLGIPLRWFYDGERSDPPVSKDLSDALERARAGGVEEVARGDRTREMGLLLSPSVVALPVWRGVVSGLDQENEFVATIDPPMEIPGFLLGGGNPANFKIYLPSGISMAPRIVQGDVVVVRKQPNPSPGTLIIAKRPDGVEYLKVFRLTREGPLLASINNDFPPILDLDHWEFTGEVVAIYKPYLDRELNLEFGFGSALRG